jgi:predicted Zn-dependent protease
MIMTGRPEEAVALVNRAVAMDPPDMGWTLRMACEAHLLAGHAEHAIETCEKASATFTYWYPQMLLVAACANHGDMAKAEVAKAAVLRTLPDFTVAQIRAKRYSDHPEYQRLAEKYLYEGLRKAGIPEQ